jgi:hypothetical protein
MAGGGREPGVNHVERPALERFDGVVDVGLYVVDVDFGVCGGAVAGVAAVLPRRIVPVIAEVIGDLPLRSEIQ